MVAVEFNRSEENSEPRKSVDLLVNDSPEDDLNLAITKTGSKYDLRRN